MQYLKDKLYPSSVKRKILAGFLLAFVAILLAFTITHFAFRNMIDTVDELSEPNEKLNVLNKVFREVTKLDQLQREEAIRNPQKPYKAFLNQSQKTIGMIDSLALLDWTSEQRHRIDSIKNILEERNKLFFSYLKLKSKLTDNKTLTKKIDTLSSIIAEKKIEIDTSVVTTQKKTTTTYVRDTLPKAKDDRSFLGKIFGKKKKVEGEGETTHIKVQEELSVSVDTLAIAKQNKALEEVDKIVHDLEKDQRTQNKKLLNRELELIQMNSLFINQLLGILHDVEREELILMHQRGTNANIVANQSISRISILLLIFFLGAAVLVYLIWVDISKSNFYKEQLEKARDEAEELSKIKQRFLANMSHEIRTPLQSIIGFAEQLKQHSYTSAEAIDAIHTSSEHLLHIVNEVLDYSRISSGNFTLAQEDFNLMLVVREVEAAMRIQTDKKNITLLVDVEHAADLTLSGDPFRLRQILYNVLGNAVKFTNKGYVKLTVKTIEESSSVRCTFDITDTGIGIKAEDIHKIFNQFEQANTSIAKHFGGTGLGLTIVKSLIEAQGGNIQVSSEVGHGSTFSIHIPFTKSTIKAVDVKEDVKDNQFNTSVRKVLVVDDDPMILRLTDLILTKYHIEHTIYHEAERLMFESVDPEVSHILMDIRMPHINGIELCQALRKKYPAHTTFVALTAHVFPQERQALHDQGFDMVLSKPFRENELLALVGIANAKNSIASKETTSLDLTALREMTLHDEALFQSVVNQFVEETQDDIFKMSQHLKSTNGAAVREIVHKLAGRIGQIGIASLSMELRTLEDKLVKGATMAELDAELEQVMQKVIDLITTLQENIMEEPFTKIK
jgi:signal transduction histidine kinase/CheY-like chemotaxis protein